MVRCRPRAQAQLEPSTRAKGRDQVQLQLTYENAKSTSRKFVFMNAASFSGPRSPVLVFNRFHDVMLVFLLIASMNASVPKGPS